MGEKAPKSRKRLYSLIAIALALCLTLSVFLSLELSAKPNSAQNMQPQTAEPPNQVTEDSINDNSIATPNATTAPTTAPTPTENSSLITEQEALNLATPIIEQYARENNRTITGIKTTLGTTHDLEGIRGGPTMYEVLNQNLTIEQLHNFNWTNYPVWSVEAKFEWTKPQIIPTYDENGTLNGGHWSSGATWIFGYTVLIWADNGQIYYAEPQGVM